jgi:ADP-dependent phosphofructokinase/glucokinase
MVTMLRSIQPRQDWNQRVYHVLKDGAKFKKLRVLSAFNAVTDYILHVDGRLVEKAFMALDEAKKKKVLEKGHSDASHLTQPAEFLSLLTHCMRIGKAGRAVASPEVLKWLEDTFGQPREKRLGGQAALMAAQLSQLGAKTHVYPALLSVDQAKLLEGHGTIPIVQRKKLVFVKPIKAARPQDPTSVSWIFEFKRGDTLNIGEPFVCPRDNRIIVAYPAAYVPSFKKEMEPFLGKLAKQVDLFLVSGYHALNAKNAKTELKTITTQLAKAKNANKKLLIHYEYVPFEDDAVGKTVLPAIAKHVDSIGLNEVELIGLLKLLGFKKEAQEIDSHECAETLYYGSLMILNKLKISRIHVHSLGYNLVVISNKAVAEKARDGALFGAVSATLKSTHGKLDQKSLKLNAPLRISEAGYNQIGQFESSIWDSWQKRKKRPISSLLRKQFMASGIFEEPKDHTVIVVPSPVATGIKTTVGLGDVVSACAVAFQVA